MTFGTAIATANSGVGLLRTLSQLRGPIDRHRFGPIIKALRDIYFTPSGVLKILETLAAGEKPGPSEVRETLTTFNDAEWRVGRRVGSIHFDALDAYPLLTLAQRRQLQNIAFGKISLRRDVQKSLNAALTGRGKVRPEKARGLLDRVVELNREIERMESILLHGRPPPRDEDLWPV
jgi:hypothetical protein